MSVMTCEACGNEIPDGEAIFPVDACDVVYCGLCAVFCGYCGDHFANYSEHRYRECGDCGDSICPESDFAYCDNCDGYRCADCGYCTCGDSDGVRPWNWKPPAFIPYGDGVRFGIEIEVDGDISPLVSVVKSYDDCEQYVWTMDDGSVNGVEVVTHPMSLDFIRSSFLSDMLADMHRAGGRAVENTGIHVHVGRESFQRDGRHCQAHVYRWLKFIYTNKRHCEHVARRSSRWAQFLPFGGGTTQAALLFKSLGYATSDDRYVAVNTSNPLTYEVRIFKSTLSGEKLLAAVEFVAATVEYARSRYGGRTISDGLMWSSFLAWLEDWRATYPALHAFLSN